MLNKKLEKILLFLTLCVLFTGIVSATDIESNNTIEEKTISDTVSDTQGHVSENNYNVIEDNKEINKNKEIEKKFKTEANTTEHNFIEQSTTYITLNKIPDVTVGDTITVEGHYYYGHLTPLTYTNMRMNINGQTYTAKTDNNGYFTYNYKTYKSGTNNVTVYYPGNTRFLSAQETKTFYVKSTGPQYSYIVLDDIEDVTYGSPIQIQGYYYYGNNIPLTYTPMNIFVNTDIVDIPKTDNEEHFHCYYTTENVFKNTVTVEYPGNKNFQTARATKTFNVRITSPISTYIGLYEINEVEVGEYTTIEGYYNYGNGVPLTRTTMTININGNNYYTKTDDWGSFKYEYKTNKTGTNTVTISYPGNNNFKSATITQTFNVKYTEPKYTYIKLNSIKEVTKGQTTTINGYYYYGNSIPLTYTNMWININGQTYKTKTDNNGYFTYNYKTNKEGSNTVIVSYPGNKNFKAANATKTFNVKTDGPQETYIKLNDIHDVAYDVFAVINGYYYYGNNIPLTYTPMTISVNGKIIETVKTDGKGFFSCDYLPSDVFKNTVTVSYHGNKNFKAATATKTFNVKITSPIVTYVDMNEIDKVEVGKYTTISGYYLYGNGVPLKQTTMRLNINGQQYTAKTDNKGYFTYNYKTNKSGTNTVIVSYPGNTNFLATSTTKTFKVSEPIHTLEIDTPLNDHVIKIIDGDEFEAWYQTEDGQANKGVHLHSGGGPISEITTPHLITDAIFYFKNDAGNIITRQYDYGDGTWMEHQLINGYTPYKVLVKYKRMTQEDLDMWDNGYAYDSKTDEWYYRYYNDDYYFA